MLTENDVITAVTLKLKELGFEIAQALNTNEKGIDIIAIKNNIRLLIEAKGATSSKADSSRFGKEFNYNQIEVHVGKALLASLKLISKEIPSTIVGIALPENEGHLKLISQIRPILRKLGLSIFWVDDLNLVKIENYSGLESLFNR